MSTTETVLDVVFVISYYFDEFMCMLEHAYIFFYVLNFIIIKYVNPNRIYYSGIPKSVIWYKHHLGNILLDFPKTVVIHK